MFLVCWNEEVDLSLANTGAVPAAGNVSSVTDRFSPVKEHLARAFPRLMDSGFDMLAAFAELLAAIFALLDAMVAATPAAYFWDGSSGFALALFGLSPAAVVPPGDRRPVAWSRLLSAVPGESRCVDGRAICLTALLAAMKLAATSGRLVSGACSKFWAGQAKDKLLSG